MKQANQLPFRFWSKVQVQLVSTVGRGAGAGCRAWFWISLKSKLLFSATTHLSTPQYNTTMLRRHNAMTNIQSDGPGSSMHQSSHPSFQHHDAPSPYPSHPTAMAYLGLSPTPSGRLSVVLHCRGDIFVHRRQSGCTSKTGLPNPTSSSTFLTPPVAPSTASRAVYGNRAILVSRVN